MKLFLITDNLNLRAFVEEKTSKYANINIETFILDEFQNLENIEQILKNQRFHLVLCYTQAEFTGRYLKSDLANCVNNYIESNTIAKFKDIMHNKSSNIVNRTTAYFNVFLEIEKAVSLTTTNGEITLDLKRIDILSEWNYPLAFLCDSYRCQYYILNYKNEDSSKKIVDILEKLD